MVITVEGDISRDRILLLYIRLLYITSSGTLFSTEIAPNALLGRKGEQTRTKDIKFNFNAPDQTSPLPLPLPRPPATVTTIYQGEQKHQHNQQ